MESVRFATGSLGGARAAESRSVGVRITRAQQDASH